MIGTKMNYLSLDTGPIVQSQLCLTATSLLKVSLTERLQILWPKVILDRFSLGPVT